MTSRAWGVLVLAASAAGCSSPTNCGAPPATVLGTWAYSASQTAPSTATLNGTLTLQPGCPSFQGSLDGTQHDDLGNATAVHLVVTGQMLGTASVEFDASFGAAARRHLGTIANDSIRGTWVDQTSGGNGSFVAVKEVTP